MPSHEPEDFDDQDPPEREPHQPAVYITTIEHPDEGPKVSMQWITNLAAFTMLLGADGARAVAWQLIDAAEQLDPSKLSPQ